MNLNENIDRIKQVMERVDGVNSRYTFNIQKLVDDKIIYVTAPGDGKGGIAKPNWEGDCSVITLMNLAPEELKVLPWRKKAIKMPRPKCIPYVQESQKGWSEEKYKQVIDSIKLVNKNIDDYIFVNE